MSRLFRVTIADGSTEVIEAETLEVNNGALVFWKRLPLDFETRFVVMKAYAPNSWRQVYDSTDER